MFQPSHLVAALLQAMAYFKNMTGRDRPDIYSIQSCFWDAGRLWEQDQRWVRATELLPAELLFSWARNLTAIATKLKVRRVLLPAQSVHLCLVSPTSHVHSYLFLWCAPLLPLDRDNLLIVSQSAAPTTAKSTRVHRCPSPGITVAWMVAPRGALIKFAQLRPQSVIQFPSGVRSREPS